MENTRIILITNDVKGEFVTSDFLPQIKICVVIHLFILGKIRMVIVMVLNVQKNVIIILIGPIVLGLILLF